MQRTVATIFTLLLLILPLHAWGQASLESPAPGSFVSGLGDIHGWKCTAGNLTFTIDNGPPGLLIYGASRGDTQGVCGDSNNGFITQFNWNLVGNGQHTIRVFDNGVQFSQATFTVTTLGAEFLTGQSATCNTRLAGQNVTLTWQQNQQNFAITGASGGGGNTDLSFLIGQWEFAYTIISTFHDHYSLPQITIQNGVPVIIGTDLDAGGPVIAARVQDVVPGSPIPFTFALLDPDLLSCDFFVFDKTGTNTVSGQYYLSLKNSSGNCGSPLNTTPYPMSGVRFSAVSALSNGTSTLQLDQQKIEETGEVATQALSEEPVTVDSDVLIEILSRLQQ